MSPSPLDLVRVPARAVEDVGAALAAVAVLPDLLAELRAVRVSVGRLERLGDDLATTNAGIETLGVDLRAGLERLSDQIDGLRGVVDGVLGNVEPLDDDLKAVGAGVARLDDRIDQLREHLDLLRTELAGLPFVRRRAR